MKKKLVSLLLTAAMVVSVCACGNKPASTTETQNKESSVIKETEASAPVEEKTYFNATGRRICDETITITMTGRQGATKDWQNVFQIQEIEKQFGIHIECQPVANDAWQTQRTLMFADDTLPDLIVNSQLSINDANKYGAEGYLLPINEYLEYMPNLSAMMEKYPDFAKAMTAPDGNIYGLPGLTNVENTAGRLNRFYINTTWLERVGKEVPETLDELYDVLVAFKEQDANGNGDPNDEIPLLYNNEMYFYAQEALLGVFGIYSKEYEFILQEDEQGKLYLANMSDAYKEYLTYMNKLYNEELIDKECFLLTSEDVESKASEDKYGVMGVAGSPSTASGHDSVYDYEWVSIAALTLNKGDAKKIADKCAVSRTVGQVISANTEYPEAICRLLDYFYTDEGTLSSTQGFEGSGISFVELPFAPGTKVANLNYNAADGKYKNSGEFRQQASVIQGAFITLTDTWAKPEGFVMGCDDATFDMLLDMEPEELSSYNIGGWLLRNAEIIRKGGLEWVDAIPPILWNEDESIEASTLLTDIQNYLMTTKAQFITGEVDVEAGWDNYIKTLKTMGVERLMELHNTAYARVYK